MAVKHPRINGPYEPGSEYGALFPDRINICRWSPARWEVWRGDEEELTHFPTHAEAIAYAQKIAAQA